MVWQGKREWSKGHGTNVYVKIQKDGKDFFNERFTNEFKD